MKIRTKPRNRSGFSFSFPWPLSPAARFLDAGQELSAGAGAADAGAGGAAGAAPDYFVRPDGTLAPEFWNHPKFPADLRESMQIRGFKTFDDMANSYAGLEKMRGYEKIPIPGKDSPPEVWDEADRKMGWPESPAGYTRPDQSAVPEAQRMPAEVVDALLAGFHKEARLSDRQLRGVTKVWDETMAGLIKKARDEAERAAAEALKPLQEKWGAADFARNRTGVETFLRSHLAPDSFARLGTTLLNDPGALELLHRIAGLALPGEPDLGDGGPPADVLAAAEIRMKELQADPERAVYDQQHPLHEVRMAEFRRLEKLLQAARQQPAG